MVKGVGEGLRICYTLVVTVIRGTLRETDGGIPGIVACKITIPRLVYTRELFRSLFLI